MFISDYLNMKIKNELLVYSKDKALKLIDANTEIVVIAPWNNQSIAVTIRMLDSVTLNSCGEFNTITSIIGNENENDSEDLNNIENIIKSKNIHENMLKLALVSPTFLEVQELLEAKEFYVNVAKQIKELHQLIATLTSETDRNIHNKTLTRLELSVSFLMPEDFTAYIVTVLLQREATDLNRLTRDTLLKAGFLAEKYNVRPSEYIEGTFTPKNKEDIDMTALTLVNDYRAQQKVEKNSNMRWIRGKRK